MVQVCYPLPQQLYWPLGLFIPFPPHDLRVFDCVEVQRSVTHIEDHIQAIQVLKCTSKGFAHYLESI
jgi:hypothetical protein